MQLFLVKNNKLTNKEFSHSPSDVTFLVPKGYKIIFQLHGPSCSVVFPFGSGFLASDQKSLRKDFLPTLPTRPASSSLFPYLFPLLSHFAFLSLFQSHITILTS